MKPTEARYTLRDPHEVLAFLSRLVAWGHTPANAWHAQPACIGWALDAGPARNGFLPNCHDASSAESLNGDANGGVSPALCMHVLLWLHFNTEVITKGEEVHTCKPRRVMCGADTCH